MPPNQLTKKYLLLLSGLLTSLTLVVVTYFSLPDDNLHFYFLDVGQGDSILIKTASNYKILVDGGPNNQVLTELEKALPFWDRRIDLLVATHPDSDHISGLTTVLKNYQVDQVWLSNVPKDTKAFKDINEAIKAKGVPVYAPILGDDLQFPDGTEVKVLWPKDKSPKFDLVDETSLVLYIVYGQFSGLLTGDAIQTTQPYPDLDSPVTVLKVPHHGAKNGVNEKYLADLKPQVSIISAGKNNRYGHPDPTTLDKLKKVGTQIFNTTNAGTVEVVSTGKSWYTRVEKGN